MTKNNVETKNSLAISYTREIYFSLVIIGMAMLGGIISVIKGFYVEAALWWVIVWTRTTVLKLHGLLLYIVNSMRFDVEQNSDKN